MPSILCAIAICAMAPGSNGQNFVYQSDDPFGIDLFPLPEGRAPNKLAFYDRDGDGDKDLFMFIMGADSTGEQSVYNIDYQVFYQENSGSAETPVFEPAQIIFEDLERTNAFFFTAFGDINNDGFMDMFAAADIDTFTGLQNVLVYLGTSVLDSFAVVHGGEYGIPRLNEYSILMPELADLDGDNDLDLILSGTTFSVFTDDTVSIACLMAQNRGTVEDPEYVGWFHNAFNSTSDTIMEFMTAGDIDNDGDMDLLGMGIGNEGFDILFHENVPTGDQPMNFLDPVKAPSGLPVGTETERLLSSALVDIDDDADLDFFVVVSDTEEEIMSVRFYENTLCETMVTHLETAICEGDTLWVGDSALYTSGLYTIELQQQNGCDSVVDLELEVYPSSATLIEEDLCDGDEYLVAGEMITASGTYEYILQNTYGCDSLISATIDFHQVDNAVEQSSNTLTALAQGMTYQWIDCNSGLEIVGANERIFIAETSGFYMVRITDEFGCEVFSECYQVVGTKTSEPEWEWNVVIFPNPASDVLYFRNETGLDISSVSIIDPLGKEKYFDPNTAQSGISLSGYSSGLHIVKIDVGGNQLIRKVIIAGYD